jgi:UDP-N-acetylglucosamine:LPS N-acetylglucosamine transferase
MKLERVIISGGGTGGHIFPAVAIADEIKANYPDVNILFIGAKGKMEMENHFKFVESATNHQKIQSASRNWGWWICFRAYA